MPRARTTTAIEDEGVVKKPRASRTRAVSSGEDAPVRAPRKRAPRKVAEPDPEPEVVRKAPTPLREQRRVSGKGTRNFIVVMIVCLVITSIGLGIGLSDKGQINVVAIVNERNEKINRGEVRTASGETVTQTIPVQGSDNRPNGGLVLSDQAAPSAPPVESTEATSTATSTLETTASSTDEIEEESATTTPAE